MDVERKELCKNTVSKMHPCPVLPYKRLEQEKSQNTFCEYAMCRHLGDMARPWVYMQVVR
jgi:hypothetical protein